MTLAAVAVMVAALYLARDVLIPFALAALLSFLLAPLVARLRRVGLPRVVAVFITVLLGFTLMAAASYLVSTQVLDLAHDLPQYQRNIDRKVRALQVAPGSPTDRVIHMVRVLEEGIWGRSPSSAPATPIAPSAPAAPSAGTTATTQNPVPVRLVEPAVTPMGVLANFLSRALRPMAEAGMVAVFVIFMLVGQEDLRDRVIRLIGTGKLSLTTHALTDAAERVSRYLAMQLAVNTGVGLVVGTGLWAIGVPNPVLWGLLALALRFIPYIGIWIAASFPVAVAFAVAPGWAMVLQAFSLFVAAELVTANFVEPYLYGISTGVSSLAVLASAVFWAWLWGPIGLLMSTPLTVCVVVLGRHVPSLEFLSIMLGDEPVLPPSVRYYQRMLALDADEPGELAEEYLRDHTVEDFFERVLLPAVRLAEGDRHHHTMDEERQAFFVEHTRRIIDDVADHPDPEPRSAGSAARSLARRISERVGGAGVVIEREPEPVTLAPADAPAAVLCVPVHDAGDGLGAAMMSVLLRRRGIAAKAIPSGRLMGELLDEIGRTPGAGIVSLSAVPPYAMNHLRYAAKRIRARFPQVRIVAGLWDETTEPRTLDPRLTEAGADAVVTTMKQAVAATVPLTELDVPRETGPHQRAAG